MMILLYLCFFSILCDVFCFPKFPYKLIDMTRILDKDEPYWPELSGYKKIVVLNGKNENGIWIGANKIETTEHIGTHMDAPRHFSESAWTMDKIPLNRVIGPGVIVDVRTKVKNNPDYRVSLDDIKAWENKYGKIPEGAVVIMNSGWQQKSPNKNLIWGTKNMSDLTSLHYPGWHEDTVKWLIDKRSIYVIGSDCPSFDYGQTKTFPVHVLISNANVCGLENVGYLDKVPPVGSIISAATIKNRDGTGFPTRLFAMIPEEGAFSNSAIVITRNYFGFPCLILFRIFVSL